MPLRDGPDSCERVVKDVQGRHEGRAESRALQLVALYEQSPLAYCACIANCVLHMNLHVAHAALPPRQQLPQQRAVSTSSHRCRLVHLSHDMSFARETAKRLLVQK